MPYLIQFRTPLTPEQVERGFDYLLALQMGGGAAVAGRAKTDPELSECFSSSRRDRRRMGPT
jgi:hypothetical protein